MSTKTLRKRIALVAVASLGLGVFTSISPANAGLQAAVTTATQPWAVTAAYASSANTASQVVGGTVTLTYSETVDTEASAADIIGSITSTGVGQLTAVTASSTNSVAVVKALGTTGETAVFPNQGVSRVSVNGAQSAQVVTYTVVVSSSTAGTQTVTASLNNDSGTPVSSKSATVTWIAATAAGINAANSTLYVDTNSTCNSAGTSKATDVSNAAAETRVRVSGVTAATTTVCLIARDGANNLVPLSSVTVVSTLGATDSSADSGSLASGRAGFDITSTAGVLGTATISAIVVDSYSNVITLSTTLNYYGSLKTLALANVTYAAKPGGTAPNASASADAAAEGAGMPGMSTSSGIWLSVVGKDASGNVIDLVADPNSTTSFTLDSDKVAGAPAAGASDTLGTTAAMSTGATDIAPTVFGSNIAIITCGAKAEKVTVNVRGLDSASARVTSNNVDVYCSGAVDKVEVTAAGQSVNVKVTDANGYPVADGTSVSLAASNGSVVAPSTKTTANGVFATPATFIANSTAATSSVTAIVGTKSGTSTPVAGTGTSIEAQVTSLVAAIAKLQKAINKINKRLAR